MPAASWGAVRSVVRSLEGAGIRYQITGGLAGNLHGSGWPLHDVDLDVPAVDLGRAAVLFAQAVTWGPARYEDDEFRLDLLRLDVRGVPFDLSGAETGFGRVSGGAWMRLDVDLAQSVPVVFRSDAVRVQPLADLIAYKRLLGREADVRDLERLRPESR